MKFLGRLFVPISVLLLVALLWLPSCQAFSKAAVGNNGPTRSSGVGLATNGRRSRFPLLALQAASTTTSCTTSSSSSSITATSSRKEAPQLLVFTEPTTGVTVKLVGCMHYNPASIALTKTTIEELARNNQLGSVVIESCDIRWEQTKKLPRAIQNLLESEMKTACELASSKEYQRPVVLGDQRINITVASLKRGFQETILDVVTPWNGGWNRLAGNVTRARQDALPFGEQYLNPLAFLDLKLLLAAPVSLVKYPLSYFFKAPIQTSLFFVLLFFIEQPADASTLVTMDQMTIGDWIGSLGLSGLEIALFARVFLKELLVERNEILAKNILDQCKLYSSKTNQKDDSILSSVQKFSNSLFGRNNKDAEMETIYAERPNSRTGAKGSQDKAVVAVLGMAHCNGIMKLLQEQKV